MKNRGLTTINGSFFVVSLRTDDAARARTNKTLASANPNALHGLETNEFIARIAAIYLRLDYLHPFSDGNSRTLQTLTKQIARESGDELDWGRFGRGPVQPDLLFIARNRSVNALASPYIRDSQTMLKISILRTEWMATDPCLTGCANQCG